MKKSNIINCYENSDNVCTRKVLFEKYNPYLSDFILADFITWGYPEPDLTSLSVAISDLKEKIENNILYGELNHPLTLDVTLANVSHSISNINLFDNKIYGNVHFVDTPSGQILKQLISDRLKVRFGIRATGAIIENFTRINEIITFDAIIN